MRFEERLLDYLDAFAGTQRMLRLADRFHPVLVSEPPGAVPLGQAFDAWAPRE